MAEFSIRPAKFGGYQLVKTFSDAMEKVLEIIDTVDLSLEEVEEGAGITKGTIMKALCEKDTLSAIELNQVAIYLEKFD